MYTTKQKIENYLLIDIDESFDGQIASWISAVESYIDKYTGRSFGSTASETRYFDLNGGREVKIDDFQTLNSVEVLELNSDNVDYALVEGKNEDFITYPYNTSPKWKLILNSNGRLASWMRGNKRLKVNAVWGDAGVPEDIVLAATMLVSTIVQKGSGGGQISQESLGDYSVSYSNIKDLSEAMDVTEILDRHKIWSL